MAGCPPEKTAYVKKVVKTTSYKTTYYLDFVWMMRHAPLKTSKTSKHPKLHVDVIPTKYTNRLIYFKQIFKFITTSDRKY